MVNFKAIGWKARISLLSAGICAVPLMGLLVTYASLMIPTTSALYWWIPRDAWVHILAYVIAYVLAAVALFTIFSVVSAAISYARMKSSFGKKWKKIDEIERR